MKLVSWNLTSNSPTKTCRQCYRVVANPANIKCIVNVQIDQHKSRVIGSLLLKFEFISDEELALSFERQTNDKS